jgi:transposase-like protein
MAETPLTCPSCYEQTALRKSHFRWTDIFHLLFLRHPYRCQSCHHRFYSHRSLPTKPPASQAARQQ